MSTKVILDSALESATRLSRLLGRRDQVERTRAIALQKLAALESHAESLTLDQTGGEDSDLLWQAAWQIVRAAKHAQAVFTRSGGFGHYGPAQERAVRNALHDLRVRGEALLWTQRHLVAAL